MQTFDQALFGHLKAGRVTFDDAMRMPRPARLQAAVQADGRRGTTMEDVASVEERREAAAPAKPAPAAPTAPAAPAAPLTTV